MKKLSDSGKPALYLCSPRKNTACMKNRCVFGGEKRYGLKNGCYRTHDPRFAVLDGQGKPLELEGKFEDFEGLLRFLQETLGKLGFN